MVTALPFWPCITLDKIQCGRFHTQAGGGAKVMRNRKALLKNGYWGKRFHVRLQWKKQSVSLGSTARHCCGVEEVIRRASAPSTPAATGYSTSFFHWLTCEAFCGLAGADWCLYACSQMRVLSGYQFYHQAGVEWFKWFKRRAKLFTVTFLIEVTLSVVYSDFRLSKKRSVYTTAKQRSATERVFEYSSDGIENEQLECSALIIDTPASIVVLQ
jgi:hypothetical protein